MSDLLIEAAEWIESHAHFGHGQRIANQLRERQRSPFEFKLEAEPSKKRQRSKADPRHQGIIRFWCDEHPGYRITPRDAKVLKEWLQANPKAEEGEIRTALWNTRNCHVRSVQSARWKILANFLNDYNEIAGLWEARARAF